MSPCTQNSNSGAAEASVLDILVVEDDPAFRALIADFLLRDGYTVRALPNGRAAMAFLSQQCPRLLVTDIFMPDADGFELLTKLRGTHPQLSIIAMSGSAGEDLELFLKMARYLGAQHTLTKPFALKELLAVVQAEIGFPR